MAFLVLVVLFLWGSNLEANGGEEARSTALIRINRVDALVQGVALAGFVGIKLLVWLL